MDELFDKVMYRALKMKATDIHMVLKDCLYIRFRLFGKLKNYDCLENDLGSKLMNYIKYRALINTNYRLLPQTGDFSTTIHQKEYFLRISYLPSQNFESIVIRILNNHEIGTIEQLSYQDDIIHYLMWLTKQESGLFLISGATGSGKSTTLYTVLKEISGEATGILILCGDLMVSSILNLTMVIFFMVKKLLAALLRYQAI